MMAERNFRMMVNSPEPAYDSIIGRIILQIGIPRKCSLPCQQLWGPINYGPEYMKCLHIDKNWERLRVLLSYIANPISGSERLDV